MRINQRITISFIGIIVLGLAFTGCIGVKTPPVTRPPAPAILVDYYRTGGTGGFDDRLVIFDNGAAIVSTKTGSREIVLNTTDIEKISNLFTEGQFSMLQANYPSPRGSNDLVKYSISYHSKTVTTEDSAVPPSLVSLIDEMNRIVKNAGTG